MNNQTKLLETIQVLSEMAPKCRKVETQQIVGTIRVLSGKLNSTPNRKMKKAMVRRTKPAPTKVKAVVKPMIAKSH